MLFLIVSSISLLVIAYAMLSHANDLGTSGGLYRHVHGVGIVLAGGAPIGIIIYDWVGATTVTLFECLFRVGVAVVVSPIYGYLVRTARERAARKQEQGHAS